MYVIYTKNLKEARKIIQERGLENYKKILVEQEEDVKIVKYKYLKGEKFIAITDKFFLDFLEPLHINLKEDFSNFQKFFESGEYELLKEKFKIRVLKTNISLKDIVGMDNLKKEVEKFKKLEGKYLPKPFLLVGLPGTGKTFIVKAIAKEINALLIDFDIKEMLLSENPIAVLKDAFYFLSKLSRTKKVVILIDEIEKAFFSLSAKEYQFMGSLMTILNEINESEEYYLNGFFIATSNNITVITKHEPAFVRKGRWDEMYYAGGIGKDIAQKMFELYFKKYEIEDKALIEYIVNIANEIYLDRLSREMNLDADFVYLPAEIAYLSRKIKYLSLIKPIDKRDLEKLIRETTPLYLFLEKEILALKNLSRYMVKLY